MTEQDGAEGTREMHMSNSPPASERLVMMLLVYGALALVIIAGLLWAAFLIGWSP